MLPSSLEILKTPSTPVPQYTCFHLLLPLLIQPATVPVSSVCELPFHFNMDPWLTRKRTERTENSLFYQSHWIIFRSERELAMYFFTGHKHLIKSTEITHFLVSGIYLPPFTQHIPSISSAKYSKNSILQNCQTPLFPLFSMLQILYTNSLQCSTGYCTTESTAAVLLWSNLL